MTEETLAVSWTVPQHLIHNVKEYVVQYKELGSAPGCGFDWIKMNKSQKTGGFKGLLYSKNIVPRVNKKIQCLKYH